jgi:2-amino-4-hydroxy-6-hydroxymethyldihydropteridine diphosphokinase
VLEKKNEVKLIKASSLYRSAPMGPQDQPHYINAVVEITSALSPINLLDFLQAIENDFVRDRQSPRWGARTLDLDILLYGQRIISLPRLRVPHYGIAQREFVLVPLAEINNDLSIPSLGGVKELLNALDKDVVCTLEKL